ncbi:hypothetical protein QL285_033597 [Trifolium repens]|nr:hypothetical protein QL285_033597 [Trifolium repens]
MIEEGSEGQNEESGHNSIDEMVDDDAEEVSKTQEVRAAEVVLEVNVEKERRSKKRNERSPATEDDQAVRAPKRIKTKAKRIPNKAPPKGNISETNINRKYVAQDLPFPSPTIDLSKPISMILPNQKQGTVLVSSSSSSSSESTLSDYITDIAEVLRKSTRKLKSFKQKTPQKTKNNSPKEAVAEDTSILDHLTPHLSGDAFTHSNLSSPNHPINNFLNVTTDPPQEPLVQEPPTTIVQIPPSHIVAPEQENPNTVINSEPETQQQPQNDDIPLSKPSTPQPEQNYSEPQIAQPEQIQQPPSDQCDYIPSDNKEHHITNEPTPSEPITNNTSSSPSPILGPVYKPLTKDELILPVDFALPILESMLKEAINIDDDTITLSLNQTIDLSKIKRIPLKRKRPEPTIPFDINQPFFNSNSEPNLELLDNAISSSLKRLKSREEEVLIFPSDIDSKIRELEDMFNESLKLLGDHMKGKIEGRGMNALNQIMHAEEVSHALKLTNFNHEEECQRLELLAAVNESISTSLEACERLAEEEARYARMVIDSEQARIAAEVERKRLADQEALKLLVDRALHIAVIETHKINENQATDEDHIMLDQNLNESDTDKGKAAIVDTTPPKSPPRLVQGSPSSAIPPAIQLALDEIKNDLREELRNEMDEFRADVREDMNRSGEATHKKIDAMMELLLKLTGQQLKP